jgi:hypothetical protein
MTASDASRTGQRFYFRGSPANEVETADDNPIPSASGANVDAPPRATGRSSPPAGTPSAASGTGNRCGSKSMGCAPTRLR